MFTYPKALVLVSLLAALPSSLVAQTVDAPAQTTLPDDSMAPADSGAELTETAPAPETPAAPVKGQIILQTENSVLAKDLVGTRVYSEAGETVGDINDLIVNLDGTIGGVVIGVGGFLGMGEKDVAVEMAAITVATDPETSAFRLILGATREDLDAAPAFKSAAQQKMDQERQQQQVDPEAGVPVGN